MDFLFHQKFLCLLQLRQHYSVTDLYYFETIYLSEIYKRGLCQLIRHHYNAYDSMVTRLW